MLGERVATGVATAIGIAFCGGRGGKRGGDGAETETEAEEVPPLPRALSLERLRKRTNAHTSCSKSCVLGEGFPRPPIAITSS